MGENGTNRDSAANSITSVLPKATQPNGTGRSSRPTLTGQYVDGAPLTFYADLDREGFQHAIESGSLKEIEGDKQALTEKARAMARETLRSHFDPNQHTHDQLRDAQFRKALADLDEAEEQRKHAEAALTKREAELAQDSTDTTPPRKPDTGLKLVLAGLLGLTVLPTVHDYIFVMNDQVMAWMCALIASILLGLGLVTLMFWDVESPEEASSVHRLGLVAGIVVALGLGVLRISGAIDSSYYLLAVGFTLMEIGLVIGIEMVARRYRAAYKKWASAQDVFRVAQANRGAAAEHVRRCHEREAEINGTIQQHIAHIEVRSIQAERTAEIEESAVKTILAGYSRGIAHNHGTVLRP